MPEANDPKPDTQKPDDKKPDAAKADEVRADGGLARALDQIKSAEQDLARLDRLVSGMERGSEGPRATQASAGALAAETLDDKTSEDKTPKEKAPAPDSKARDQGLKGGRPMLRALVGLVLAIGILGAAFASQYRDEARSISKSIMARWAPPAAGQPRQASAVKTPAQPGHCNWLLRISLVRCPRRRRPRKRKALQDLMLQGLTFQNLTFQQLPPPRLPRHRSISRNRSRPSQASLRPSTESSSN